MLAAVPDLQIEVTGAKGETIMLTPMAKRRSLAVQV